MKARLGILLFVVLVITGLQAVLGLVSFGLALQADAELLHIIRWLLIPLYLGVGAYLVLAAKGRPGALEFGVLFVAIAASYAQIRMFALPPALLAFADGLAILPSEVLLPYVAWRLVSVFPQVPRGDVYDFVCTLGRGLSLAFAFAVVGLHIYRDYFDGFVPLLDRGQTSSYFWVLFYLSLGASVLVMALRAKRIGPEQKERLILLLIGAGLASAVPLTVIFLLVLVPVWEAVLFESLVADGLVQASMASLPVLTCYSLLTTQVFAVRPRIVAALKHYLPGFAAVLVAALPLLLSANFLVNTSDLALYELPNTNGWAEALMAFFAAAFLFLYRSSIESSIRRVTRVKRQDIVTTSLNLFRTVPNLDAEKLEKYLSDSLCSQLNLSSCYLLLSQTNDVHLRSRTGQLEPLHLRLLQQHLDLDHGPSVSIERDELELSMGLHHTELFRWMRANRLERILPLHDDKQIIGAVALGERVAMWDYAARELRFLSDIQNLIVHRLMEVNGSFQSSPDTLLHCCFGCGRVGRDPVPCLSEDCSGPFGLVPQKPADNLLIAGALSKGSFGEVYHGQDTLLGREVVLKFLSSASQVDHRVLRNEASAMAAINHPNVATIYSLSFYDSAPIVVQEFLPHGTLRDRLNQGALPVRKTVQLATGLASGLAELHSRGYLHRDVKPSNIGYSNADIPKLIDFGLAQLLETSYSPVDRNLAPEETAVLIENARNSVSSDRAAAGTPLYMCPEALRGGEPEYSFDIWSLTVVVFEVYTGMHPFQQANQRATLRAILRCDDRVWKGRLQQAPQSLVEFFQRGFSPKPGERPGSAEEFRKLVLDAFNGVSENSANDLKVAGKVIPHPTTRKVDRSL